MAGRMRIAGGWNDLMPKFSFKKFSGLSGRPDRNCHDFKSLNFFLCRAYKSRAQLFGVFAINWEVILPIFLLFRFGK